MADEQVMTDIKTKGAGIAGRALNAANSAAPDGANAEGGLADALVAFCQTLADEWRGLADMWTKSRRRGWQSTSQELRRNATAIEVIGKDLANIGQTPIVDTFTNVVDQETIGGNWTKTDGGEAFSVEPDPSNQIADHAFVGRDNDPTRCSYSYGDGLCDAPAAEHRSVYDAADVRLIVAVATAGDPPDDDIRAFLAGETDTLPDLPDARKGGPVEQYDNPSTGDRHAETWTLEYNDKGVFTIADMTAAVPLADAFDDPFSDPTPYTYSPPVPAGARRLSFAELATPPGADAVPDHWSWSQLEDIEDCGAKYRMRRLDAVPQVPQWALIGGNAFHATVAEIERAAYADRDFWRGAGEGGFGSYDPPGLVGAWNRIFHAEIAQHAGPGLPMDQWRASGKGKEGYDWWRVEGAAMLATYVEQRKTVQIFGALPTLMEIGNPAGGLPPTVPALEIELSLQVDFLRVTGIVDQIWSTPDGPLIVDLKSGAHMPDDTAQLGLYAWMLMQAWFGPNAHTMLHPTRRQSIRGSFYNARKGTYSEPVDLLARHPFEEYRYRFGAANALRRVGAYLPRRSSFCGGCSVRYACPIGGR